MLHVIISEAENQDWWHVYKSHVTSLCVAYVPQRPVCASELPFLCLLDSCLKVIRWRWEAQMHIQGSSCLGYICDAWSCNMARAI